MLHQKIVAFALLCTVALAAVPGCSQVRMHTYPPDLVYLDQQQVQNAMRRLLVGIWNINDVLDNNESIPAYDRERIIATLKDMETETDKLGAGAEVTNHLIIDSNIDEFKSSIRTARKAVEGEPPNYYLAGRLSGGCLACHRRRQNPG